MNNEIIILATARELKHKTTQATIVTDCPKRAAWFVRVLRASGQWSQVEIQGPLASRVEALL